MKNMAASQTPPIAGLYNKPRDAEVDMGLLKRYFLELDDWMLGGQGKLRPVAPVALTSDPSAAQESTFMVVEARTSFIFA